MERPRVGVSSCLLGSPVRFDGGHKRFRFLTDELGPYVDWVPMLAVEDEGRLNDAGLREAFVERVFAAARLRALLSREWEPRDLAAAARGVRFCRGYGPCSSLSRQGFRSHDLDGDDGR